MVKAMPTVGSEVQDSCNRTAVHLLITDMYICLPATHPQMTRDKRLCLEELCGWRQPTYGSYAFPFIHADISPTPCAEPKDTVCLEVSLISELGLISLSVPILKKGGRLHSRVYSLVQGHCSGPFTL